MPGQTSSSSHRPGCRPTSFNGGPDNCPARRAHFDDPAPAGHIPSMEGRTIARPDRSPRPGRRPARQAFNGGPDNCPARPVSVTLCRRRSASFNGGPDNCPARQVICTRCVYITSSFNGGPDNCPARPVWPCVVVRAGIPAFNGGPDNCPARHDRPSGPPHRDNGPSMEGRTIARPDSTGDSITMPRVTTLQWRAGQLPGQTSAHSATHATPTAVLQWRAGQLPGQTPTVTVRWAVLKFLQWRAGQLPGQTPRLSARPPS